MRNTMAGSYESIEVRVFINLLRVVDNRHQDIPLLSVLRSQIGGFTMDELIWLRTHSRGKTFYRGHDAVGRTGRPPSR